MCNAECPSHLRRNANRPRDAEWPLFLKNLTNVFSFYQFHHNERSTIFGVVEIVHPHGIRMPEFAGHHRFLLKTLQEVCISSDHVADNFYGANFVEREMANSIDHPHAPIPIRSRI